MNRMRAVSLFSNCGAGDLGYRKAGFRFDVMAELESSRLEVCLLNHPGAVGVPGDLRKTWQQVVKEYRAHAGDERPALLCACPPCQGMSSARSGKGHHDDAMAGSKDERNLLVTIIVKVARKLSPSVIVVENVPAFFSRKVYHPTDKWPVSAANYLISELSKNYVAFPIVANLCDFGIPQSRNRAFLTFIRKDVAGLRAMLNAGLAPFPRPTHTGEEGSRIPVSIGVALRKFGLPKLDAVDESAAHIADYQGFHSVPVWDDRFYSMVSAIPKGNGNSAWENCTCSNCGCVSHEESVLCIDCGEPLRKPTIRENDGTLRLIKGFKSSYRRMHNDKPAATITTASGHVGSDYTIHPTQNRLLSPLECSLLQTFPKDFKWGGALTKYGHTSIREMIGEAVPPAFTRRHGRVIYAILNETLPCLASLLEDARCNKGWTALRRAAKKDGREDPRSYFNYVSPKTRRKVVSSIVGKMEA